MSMAFRRVSTRAIALVFASALLPIVALAQTARPEAVGMSSERLQRVNEMVDRYMTSGDITGAVTLVARNGRIVYLQAQGVTDAQSKKPMQRDTIFRIASMAKPVAGTAIMMLVEEGKVRLTDPVSKFIPSFRDVKVAVPKPLPPPPLGGPAPPGPATPENYTVPAARDVTILDLMTHTSGLLSGPVGNAAGASLSANRRVEGLRYTEKLGTTPLEFQPGTRWAYSAVAGFDVLAHVVEIASGKTFNEFISERIFKPVGAKEIFFWPNAAQRERLVTAYMKGTNGGLSPRENPDAMSSEVYFSGAGGLMSTAESYGRFAMMLANQGEANGVRLLAPRTVELMGSAFIPDTLPGRQAGEGFGLSVRVVTDPVARRTAVSKGTFGWSGAYGTHFFVDPEKRVVGVLMIQTPITQMREDFENAVMQAVID